MINNLKKSKKRKLLAAMFIGALMALFLEGCGLKDSLDYSDASNWAVCETDTEEEKAADVFFVCPTVVSGEENIYNMDVCDEESRASFLGATLMEKGIYDDNARFFAPYYRQAALNVYELSANEREQYLASAYEDVKASFEYYLKTYNGGRPIILAGFSQGADMVKRLMFEYAADPGIEEKLVAAYMIGWNITDDELLAHPYVRMAEGEADTGVIVSFCSESEDITSSVIVPETTKGINPLNWMCDETPADKTLNAGACFTDYSGEIQKEIPELTGAYLDPERGTLKVTDVDKTEYPAILSIFEDGNYHIYDYQFFYRNLERNVQARIAQYLTLEELCGENFSSKTFKSINELLMPKEESVLYKDCVTLAPDVTADMCEADYWVKNLEKADMVIADKAQIEAFNESLLPKTKVPESFYYYVGEDRATELDGEQLLALLQIIDLPAKDTEFFNLDKTPVEEEFWQDLVALRDEESVEDNNKIRYGIALKSTGIRKGPSDTVIAGSTDYDYCDELQNSSVRMNEGLIILWESADKEWYYVATPFCLGWIRQQEVGMTEDYDFWQKSLNPEDFVVITDNHAALDIDPSNELISARAVDMGTKLALVTDGSYTANNYDRHGINNYFIMLPCRDEEGGLFYEKAYLPQHIGANRGYLEYTQRNVATLAFKMLGEQYGWAGLFDNRDCSQYMKEVYRCFGIELPRTTGALLGIKNRSLNVTNMSTERKQEILDNMPVGALLIFPGHVMMYLGESDGEYFCISATGSLVLEPEADVVRVRSVMLNSLNHTYRGSGKTWMESVTAIKIP